MLDDSIEIKQYFHLVNMNEKGYKICINEEVFPLTLSEQAKKILPARLLGFSYDFYVRLMRDEFSAKIIFNNDNTIDIFVERNENIKKLIKLLNYRLKLAIMYFLLPNLKEKIKQLELERKEENETGTHD